MRHAASRLYYLLGFFAIFLVEVYPILHIPRAGIFYSIDPEVMYLGNALSFLNTGYIQYYDHPGTPAILLLSVCLWPFVIFSNLVAHQSFSTWAFINIDVLFVFSRLLQSLLLSAGLIIISKAIVTFTNSNLAAIFFLIACYCFRFTPYLGSSISPEATSLFIISIWIVLFLKFVKTKNPLLLSTLSIIAGIAVANKLTNSFLLFATLGMCFFLKELAIKHRLYNGIFNICLMAIGFFFSTIFIWYHYVGLFLWVFRLAGTSSLHGTGKQSLFDWASYSTSFLGLFQREGTMVGVSLIGLLAMLIYLLIKKNWQSLILAYVYVIMLIGFFVFAKYPLSHYQLTNFTIMLMILTLVVAQLKKGLIIAVCILVIVPAYQSMRVYYQNIQETGSKTAVLQDYIATHPAKVATVWEWGRSKDFVRIWMRAWANDLFTEELATQRPDLLELGGNMDTVLTSYQQPVPIFEACWDKFYIQESIAPRFLEKYPNRNLKFSAIPNTFGNGVIESDHCVQQ